jgi:hypothetical protein
MKVLGVGFGRTGTVSLTAALDELGFGPCYRMQTVIDEPWRAQHWLAAARGEAPDWETVFAGFASTVEWPAAAFWRALMAHYPDAKVILTVREADAWSASARRTIFRDADLGDRLLGAIRRRVLPGNAAVQRAIGAVVVHGVFDGRVRDREHLAAVFRRHNAAVAEHVAADRLLVYDVSQGWAPLCAFLGVPVPPAPFASANDARAFRRKEWTDVARAARRNGRVAGAAAVLALGTGARVLTSGFRRGATPPDGGAARP